MKRPLALVLIVAWCAFCAASISYFSCVDILSLRHSSNEGPYGIFFDREQVATLSAIPARLLSTLAFMNFGKKAGITTEGLTALAYWFSAIGLWQFHRIARYFAIVFFGFEAMLLGLWVGYAVPALLAVPADDLKPFALAVGLPFLALKVGMILLLLRFRASGPR